MILLEKATAEKNYATYLAEAADTEETVLAATKAGDIVLFKKEDTIEKKMHVGDSFFQLATSCDGDGGGTEYTNIVYNKDNTVTLTDKDGAEHTMSCTYENDKLVDVTYDGKAVELTYNGDILVNVGKTAVDMGNAPVTSGGNTELNIVYGDTEPDDTSKLWIKANEPESIVFGKDFDGFESIETVGNLPIACNSMGCARVGNKVYLFGGSTSDTDSLNTINVFNIETQTLTTLSTIIPDALTEMGCANVGNKIYLFGGYYYYSGEHYLSIIYEFNTETEILTKLKISLPFGYGSMGCASIGTKIYLFGGYDGRNRLNTICVFDTEMETITTLSTTLPIACNSMGCASIGTKIYLFGGFAGINRLDTICVFDTEMETITTLPTTLPIACNNMGCASIGTKIYLFGGYLGSSINTINQFSLTHDLTQNNIEVITGYKNFFNIINTNAMKVEIGINSVLIGNAENQAENCEAYLYQNNAWVQI